MFKHTIKVVLLITGMHAAIAGGMGNTNNTYDLNGIYAGVGTGFLNFFYHDNHTISLTNPSIANTTIISASNTGILFEGHLGYGQFINPNTYLGAKGAVYYTPLAMLNQESSMLVSNNILTTNNNINQITITPIYNIDVVLGYELYSHILSFVEAGVSFSAINAYDTLHNIRTDLTANTTIPYNMRLNTDTYKTGYNIGIGTDYQINNNWFLSGELIYNYLGKNSTTSTSYIPNSTATQTTITHRTFQSVSLFTTISYLLPE